MPYQPRQIGGTDPFTYAVLRNQNNANAPTLIFLGGSIYDMLLSPSNYPLAYLLINHPTNSWNVVSLDLPCHGDWSFPNARPGLDGWYDLTVQNIDFIALLNSRISRMMADMIAAGLTNPAKIATAGISRGGFTSFHALQAGIVNHAAGISPVTKLSALSEYAGWTGAEPLPLDPVTMRTNGFRVSISDIDTRVGTDIAVQLCSAARDQTKPPLQQVELHVTQPSVSGVGHTQIVGDPLETAQWLLRRLALPAL